MNEPSASVGRYAGLLSRAKSHAARSLVSGICADVLGWERRSGFRKTWRRAAAQSKFNVMIERFVGDLLNAAANPESSGTIWRALNSKSFKAPVSLRDFRRALDALRALALVEYRRGRGRYVAFDSSSVGQLPGKASRFAATPTLLKRAADAGVLVRAIDDHFKQEPPLHPLRLKKRSKRTRRHEKIAGAPARFDRTPQTSRLEDQIVRLNEFISHFEIGGAIHYGFERIFNEGDDLTEYRWNKGGRLYSIWPPSGELPYQQLSGEERARITINGEETCEIDVRACNLTIFHAKLKIPFDATSDPYARTELGRDIVKLWTVASFGANKSILKWSQKTAEEYLSDTLKVLGKVCRARVARDQMLAAYPALGRLGEEGVTWADLMFAESTVIIGTMTALRTVHQVPSLPVHDSLIVPRSSLAVACESLQESFRGVLHVYPWLTTKSPNPDVQKVVQTANERCKNSSVVSAYDL